jgi:hypothetical protein
LSPVLTLAKPAGLDELLEQRLPLTGPWMAKAAVNVTALIGGTVAGAGCIDDMYLLWHGAMDRLFNRVGSVDVGHVPARVRLRACPAVGRGRRSGAGWARHAAAHDEGRRRPFAQCVSLD